MDNPHRVPDYRVTESLNGKVHIDLLTGQPAANLLGMVLREANADIPEEDQRRDFDIIAAGCETAPSNMHITMSGDTRNKVAQQLFMYAEIQLSPVEDTADADTAPELNETRDTAAQLALGMALELELSVPQAPGWDEASGFNADLRKLHHALEEILPPPAAPPKPIAPAVPGIDLSTIDFKQMLNNSRSKRIIDKKQYPRLEPVYEKPEFEEYTYESPPLFDSLNLAPPNWMLHTDPDNNLLQGFTSEEKQALYDRLKDLGPDPTLPSRIIFPKFDTLPPLDIQPPKPPQQPEQE